MSLLLKAVGAFALHESDERKKFFFGRGGILAAGFLWFLILLSPGTKSQDLVPPIGKSSLAKAAYVENQVVIKFVKQVEDKQKRELYSSLNSVVVKELSLIGAELVQISGMTVEQAISLLKKDSRIQYAEPNFIWHADIIPNDPFFNLLWGMHNTGQTGGTADADIDAAEAWNISTGDSTIIGVIDTGVDTAHADLMGNIWTNPGEIPNNGIDDDGNGYVDDIHGWDFVNWDNGPVDDNGHGTHTSGTIAAVGNNAIGVAGVCWSAKIMALKFLDSWGYGTTADAILAVEYAIKMKAKLTSNSWGGGPYSQALKDAIDSSGAHGMLFVAAAGNDRMNNDLYPHYPSSYDLDNIIAVAATDHNDSLADEPNWGSNYGLTSVDLGAPGVNIYSTIPGNSYTYLSGTSMATPHVSGAVALIWSKYPSLTHLLVKDRIMRMADSLPDLAGKCVTGGRLNVFMAMAEPDSIPPSPISDLTVTNTGGSWIALSWTATGDDSSTGTASYYDVRYSLNPIDSNNFDLASQATEEPRPQTAGSSETFVVTGLNFNSTYYFAIKALDEWGNSSGVSNSPSGTTLGPPDISVSPDSLSDSLFTGGKSTQIFTIYNSGVSDLLFDISIEKVSLLTQELMALRSRMISRTPASTDYKMQPFSTPSDRPYDFGHPAFREKINPVTMEIRNKMLSSLKILLLKSGGDVSEIRNLLLGFPDISVADTFDASALSPTLDQLLAYNSVMVMNGSAFGDPIGIGDVLADYVNAGGGVVLTLASFVSGWEIGGRFLNENYMPFNIGTGPGGSANLGNFNASHPIMKGVTTAFGDVLGIVTMANGAEWVADWNNGYPFVATKGPSVAAVNIFVASSGYWTGDIPLILHNAALWSTGGAPWLDAEPDSGTLPAGSSKDITVTFDAAGLNGGEYYSNIIVSSNDPDEPEDTVSAHLKVTGAPDIAAEPDSLDFGIVYIGYPEHLPLLISNQGTDILTVTGIVTDVAEFSVDLTSFVLSPGKDTVVSVSFAPTAVGEVPGNLTISSDDPDEPALTVALRGKGLVCPNVWVNPASVSDSLFTAETSIETLTVGNSGGSPLYLKVELDNFLGPTALKSIGVIKAGPISKVDYSIWELLGSRVEKKAGYDLNTKTTRDLYEFRQDGFQNISANPGDVLASWPAPSPIQWPWGLGFDGSEVWVSDADGITDNEVSTVGVLLSWFSCSGWVGYWPGDMDWDGSSIWQVNVGGDNGIYKLDPATGNVLGSIHDPGHVWDAISQRGLAYDKKADVFYVGGWNQDRVYRIKGPGWNNPGEILSFFDFPNVSGLAWHPGGTLWIAVNASTDFIFQVNPENGSIISQFLAPGTGGGYEGAGLAIDKKGNLWCISQATKMVYLVESGVPAYQWLAVTPEACTVGVGNEKGLEVRYDAAGLYGGDYTADIILRSNDCDQPSLTVPASLHVTGAPDIVVTPDSLNFGTVYLGYPESLPLIVSNEGTDNLTVTSITSDVAEFSVNYTQFALAPERDTVVNVTFAPTSTGVVSGNLTLSSNDPDEPVLNVVIRGEGIYPPSITVVPDSFMVEIDEDDSTTRTMTIGNVGLGDLTWEIPGFAGTSVKLYTLLEATFSGKASDMVEKASSAERRSNAELEQISHQIRSISALLSDLTGKRIGITYSGSYTIIMADLQARGATVRNVSFPLTPGILDSLDVLALDDAITYASTSDVNAIRSWLQNGKSLLMQGDDNSPNINTLLSGTGVSELSLPSCYDDIFTNILPHPTTVGVDSISELSYCAYFTVIPPAQTIVYDNFARTHVAVSLLGSGKVIAVGNEIAMDYNLFGGDNRLFVNQVFDWLAVGNFVSVSPVSGTVAPGLTQDVTVKFNARHLIGGDYSANIAINNNDPVNNPKNAPVHLHVIGIPNISVIPDSLDFGPTFVGYGKTDTLWVKNTGSESLIVNSIISSQGDFSPNPVSFSVPHFAQRAVSVTFAPATTGEITGLLTINSNDPDEPSVTVTLRGEGLIPPDIAVSPDSFSKVLVAGDTLIDTLTITNSGASDLKFNILIEEYTNVLESIKQTNPQARSNARSKPVTVDDLSIDLTESRTAKNHLDESPNSSRAVLMPYETAAGTNQRYSGIAAVSLPFYDGFEAGNYSRWMEDFGSGTKEVTSSTAAAGVYSFHYYYTGPNSHFHGIHQEFIAGSQPKYIGFHIRSGSTATHDAYFVLTANGNYTEVIWFFAEGNGFLYVNEDVGGDNSYPYQALKWYHIEFKNIDWSTKSFDYYVDGNLVKANIPFRNAWMVNDIDRLYLYNFSSNSEAWWDEIRVGEVKWLYVNPDSGVVPAGSSTKVAFTCIAPDRSGTDYFAGLVITSNDPDEGELTLPVQMRVVAKGDVNADFKVGITDVVYLINYILHSGPEPKCLSSAELNCDGKVSVSDIIYLINYLFRGGPDPCE